ncbi:MAG: exonuclease domain-containing protein [Chloroflexi bacterium]|nr:exonuclease domain-containing protein [Chloroflexota bacterium]
MDQTCVSIDLEMTSAQPENQQILEIAAVKFRGATILDSWSTLVNPATQIPYNIQVLTGIRQEDVQKAPALGQVVSHLVRFVANHPLIAHSVSLDVECLRRKGIPLDNAQIDTFELATLLLPNLASYSLESVALHLGVSFRKSHRAADDALTTIEVFNRLLERAEELDLSVLQEINRLVGKTKWALKPIFLDLERRKSRTAFSGTSIRQQLAAKAGLGEGALDFSFLGEANRATLTPSAKRQRIEAGEIEEMMSPGGKLASRFAGFEPRPQQVRMMNAVARAFNDSSSLIVEAATGTGKSLAYLLPAIYFAVKNGEHVVVSTNTINLQDQLYGKDVPDLEKILSLKFRACQVKGRSNYLCLSRWAAVRRQELKEREILTLVKILIWLTNTRTGDVNEIGRLADDEMITWGNLSAATETCSGNQCTYFQKGTCFLYRARRDAETSHIIIVNHALLLSDLGSGNGVLPDYRYLVVDEAHHLEDEATDQLGYAIRQNDLRLLLDELSRESTSERPSGFLVDLKSVFRGSKVPPHVQRDVESLAQELRDEVDQVRRIGETLFEKLFDFLRQNARENRGYDVRLRLTRSQRVQPAWSEMEICCENFALHLRRLRDGLARLFTIFGELETHGVLDYDNLMAQLQRDVRSADESLSRIVATISTPNSDYIYWISTASGRGEVELHAAPLHVGPLLQDRLFSSKESVVLTSATLSTSGSFDFIRERLGFSDVEDLIVSSPFDYVSSTLLYVPQDIPEPEKPYYQRSLQQALVDLCRTTHGRTLVLFTSHSQLRQTWQAIRQPLQESGILVLGHKVDGMPRRQLLQTFKTNPKTVLLGANSFWEGIDVVGDALSVLVIARLPFTVPNDPVFAARSELFDDPFHQYSLPQAILRFKQGFGRLIRSKTDRGVVVILDKRLQSKSYGPSILRSLPECTVRHGTLSALPQEAGSWLQQSPS